MFNGEVPADFNWKEYSVMRIPVDKLPDGFMDTGQVAEQSYYTFWYIQYGVWRLFYDR